MKIINNKVQERTTLDKVRTGTVVRHFGNKNIYLVVCDKLFLKDFNNNIKVFNLHTNDLCSLSPRTQVEIYKSEIYIEPMLENDD